ncbi:hypothetical protein [Thalassospira lucentensis]|uniref:hypothetical protein n=1 Tax=Thalassospira lucentensis TaxID=168935 RepID=UPI003AA7DD88
MAGIFSFELSFRSFSPLQRCVVMFCGHGFNIADFSDEVRGITKKRTPPDQIILLLGEEDYDCFEVKGSEIERNASQVSGKTDIYIQKFTSCGQLHDHRLISSWKKLSKDVSNDNEYRQQLVRQGMTEIFRKRSGLLEAGETAYFTSSRGNAKEDEDRRAQFLRASNALSEGSEVLFIAFCLLPHIPAELKRIHVDTSTISSVVYAALLLRGNTFIPEIHNFKSYQGISEHEFSDDGRSLVIISASQSGNLFKRIKEKISSNAHVLTLFKLSNEPAGSEQILCNLKFDERLNPGGYIPRGSIRASHCQSMRPIQMVSEQFIVGLSQTKGVIPARRHLPDVVQVTLQSMLGEGIFACHYAASIEKTYPIWVNETNIAKSKVFKDWLKGMVRKRIPASVSKVVYLDNDKGSHLAAKSIGRSLRRLGVTDFNVVACSKLQKNVNEKNLERAVVIVGGAIGRGRKFLQASQVLREVAQYSHRVYLTGVCMTESVNDTKFLRSNLIYKGHTFDRMIDLHVQRHEELCSWSVEIELVDEILDQIEDERGECYKLISGFFERRRDAISDKKKGLKDNVFLNNVLDQPYALRSNFAFVDEGHPCENISQADVFTVASTLLQSLRLSDDIETENQLINDEFQHSVIEPTTFTRYNDGVLQAAFLRAALPVELSYVESERKSREMANIVIDCLMDRRKIQGEAVVEFLMALLLGRLRLRNEDMEQIWIRYNRLDDYDVADFLIEVLYATTDVGKRIREKVAL